MARPLEYDRPRIAVLGSCISRDVFNTRILGEEYKDDVSVVATVYQEALPSLGRNKPVSIDLAEHVKPPHRRPIELELSGRALQYLVSARPDIIVMDFFADIHFGTVTYDGLPITRNTMAFDSYQLAERYFSSRSEGRHQFTSINDDYTASALHAVNKLIDQCAEAGVEPTFIINSGRYATHFVDGDGNIKEYRRNTQHLLDRNVLWDKFDNLIANQVDGHRIEYPGNLIIGDAQHPWGPHPVHYVKDYYKYLWHSIQKLIQ